MRIGVALLALGLAAGCASAPARDETRKVSPADRRKLEGLAEMMGALGGTEIDEQKRWSLLAEGFSEVSGESCFADYARAEEAKRLKILLIDCKLICSEQVGREMALTGGPNKLELLVRGCGPERYGLDAASAWMASEELLIAQHVAAWYAPRRAGLPAGDPLAARLDAQVETAELPLPIGLGGPVSLPQSRAATPVRAARYVVLAAGGELTGGRMPAVAITRRGLKWLRRYPGAALAAGDVADKASGPVLLLAARTLPAARLIARAGALGAAELQLGIDARRGRVSAHAVTLAPPAKAAAAPRLALYVDTGGLLLTASDGGAYRCRDLALLPDALAEARRRSGLAAEHEIVVGVTSERPALQDLVAVLDVLHAAGFTSATLTTAAPPPDLLAAPRPQPFSIGAGSHIGAGARARRVIPGEPRMGAGLDPEIVRRVIRMNLLRLQACYLERLAARPGLAGTVTVRFVIDAAGRVARVRAGGLGDRAVERCMASGIKHIAFPRPDHVAKMPVTVPFTLR